ncbi:uncharacterized protein LOC120257632 isoform X2 [Dioscorea cayenensis subsp. rotundata]|uniref:Uncharacterized protein LOC120257632 isoform X2 n=1 Tax=Dioscorea cayennensis subsp. rotundata TaxID=55577 RepID=A0AB40B1N2_DIOCR|nr:uncharacterized protein LOC120257632 isoform X2 [Dioscorea cayenensis subsp. rotundata]
MKVSIDMAKDVDTSFRHPLPGGLSLLSMDFTSKGISWADNICQKWGSICVDNILSQEPCKYVGVFGEHFRRMLDEVCKKSRLGFDDLNASINGMNHVAHCDEDSNCETSENLDENLGSHCSDAVLSARMNHVAQCVEDLNSATSENSEENLSSDCFDAGARTIECLDGLSREKEEEEEEEEEEEGIVHDIVDLHMESTEDFEDVNIKDIMDDIETSKLVSISQPACNKVSYKRKFRHAFYSKIISAKKDKDDIEACFTNNVMKKQDMLGNAASEISLQQSFEADWEIL